MNGFTVHPLSTSKVDQAFPVMQLVEPSLAIDTWQEYALNRLAAQSPRDNGILAAEDAKGYIFGLVTYVIDWELPLGRTLLASNLIAIDGFERRRRSIATSLVDALEQLARSKQCRAMKTLLPVSAYGLQEPWVFDLLRSHGHQTGHHCLCKVLA